VLHVKDINVRKGEEEKKGEKKRGGGGRTLGVQKFCRPRAFSKHLAEEDFSGMKLNKGIGTQGEQLMYINDQWLKTKREKRDARE